MFLYPRHTKYAMGAYSFHLFFVCVSVSVNNFHVCSITLKQLDIFSWNFTQMLNTMRQYAEHMNRNWISYFWSYCPFCVNFRVCFISLKSHDIFSWNFTQMLNAMRRHAEHMSRNSGFPTFGVIALCVITLRVRSISLKPLEISSWNFTQMLNHKTRCRTHEPYLWLYPLHMKYAMGYIVFVFSLCVCQRFSCPLHNFKTAWHIFMKLHTNVKHHETTCKTHDP